VPVSNSDEDEDVDGASVAVVKSVLIVSAVVCVSSGEVGVAPPLVAVLSVWEVRVDPVGSTDDHGAEELVYIPGVDVPEPPGVVPVPIMVVKEAPGDDDEVSVHGI
jgi:hypothetical protein